MKAIRRLPLSAALPVLAVIVLATGCGKENPAPSAQNLLPDTTLELVADRGDTTSLRVHLRWSGSDPDGEVLSWEWDFGDGSNASGVVPSHTYNGAGTYVATLTVTDPPSGL